MPKWFTNKIQVAKIKYVDTEIITQAFQWEGGALFYLTRLKELKKYMFEA